MVLSFDTGGENSWCLFLILLIRKTKIIHLNFSNLFSNLSPLHAPYPVDMPFKVSAVQKLRQHKLFKGRHRAGIKAGPFPVTYEQPIRQGHIAHPKGGGQGAGKGIQIDHVIPLCAGKHRLLRLS